MSAAAGYGRPLPSSVSAADLLPTAQAVALAKGLAARSCALKAAEHAWPDLRQATQWIDAIPTVALAVLAGLCPEVAHERLARCLGLDGHAAAARLESHSRRPTWPADLVAALVQDVRGGL